jgi:hypothetical protein
VGEAERSSEGDGAAKTALSPCQEGCVLAAGNKGGPAACRCDTEAMKVRWEEGRRGFLVSVMWEGVVG